MTGVRKVNRGDRITADWANALAEALIDQSKGRFPAELGQRILALAALLQDPDRFVPVKIDAVRTAGTAIGGAWLPSQVKYKVLGIRRPGIDLDNVVPYYGREVEGDEARIYPAKVGMTAYLERDIVRPNGDGTPEVVSRLMLLPGSERVARKRCGQVGA